MKIVLAFGVCVALIVASALPGIGRLARLSGQMKSMYFDNTVPIEDISRSCEHAATSTRTEPKADET
ncbi:MCP four helix bundle domain-containing protein [Paraburkholderia nemoris]|uniref:MCP four helix bundle domain-containing protein n=1 Tax=Paraburkholderia nemoris TaxID=2793076 RepID=UPI0038BD9087